MKHTELEPNDSEVEAVDGHGLEIPARNWDEMNKKISEAFNDYSHFSPSCWAALNCLYEISKSRPKGWESFLFK